MVSLPHNENLHEVDYAFTLKARSKGWIMGLAMKTRRDIVKEVAPRYQRSNRKGKGAILVEFTGLTGYCRCYASWLLKNWGKRIVIGRHTLVGGEMTGGVRRRKKRYGDDVVKTVKRLWCLMDFPCGKRLAPSLKWMIPKLEHHKELAMEEVVREKLLTISASTIDRLLRVERQRMAVKGRHGTKPGTLLKHQIPIRTFSEWDEQRPGFLEIDLVGHDGGYGGGDFCQTLNVTDVASSWTEAEAVRNKAQVWVFEALDRIKRRLPFPVLGIDSDNDSAFINNHLLRYCQEHHITFTRTRAYRKNDNCFVEQKNYTVVRKAVGYLRYDTEDELRALNDLYRWLRLYINLFQPVAKLVSKTRKGSKVTKRYDEPKTPYHRLMESPSVRGDSKEKLRSLYEKTNPVLVRRGMLALQKRLLELHSTGTTGKAPVGLGVPLKNFT